MKQRRHFVTGEFQSHTTWLDDTAFGMVLDNVVPFCVDTVILHQGRVLLGKRGQEPMRGGWCTFGGKMNPGEDFQKTAQRILKRELGLTIDSNRLEHLNNIISVVWNKRAQVPKNHGCHMATTIMVLMLVEQELSLLHAAIDHERLEWFELHKIAEPKHHPWIVRVAEDIVAHLEG